MLRLILITGTGSFFGGVSRFLTSRFIQNYAVSAFPCGTIVVNILGCFLTGLYCGLWERGNILDAEWRMFLPLWGENIEKQFAFQKTLKFIKIIIILLLSAFIIVVVYPLHFLPMRDKTYPTVALNLNTISYNLFNIEGILLALFATIIIVIIIVFILNIQDLLKQTKKNEEACHYYGKIKYYSVHLLPFTSTLG